jgi:hypothetical protein
VTNAPGGPLGNSGDQNARAINVGIGGGDANLQANPSKQFGYNRQNCFCSSIKG